MRNREEIAAEIAFIETLSASGIPVARAIPRTGDLDMTPLNSPEGERQAVLFERAAGAQVADISLAQSRAFGRLAAALHTAADNHSLPFSRPEIGEAVLLLQPLEAIHTRFAEHSEQLASLDKIAARVGEAMSRLPREAPVFGLCHGDLHPGNVRFGSSNAPTLFDFDLCGYGWRFFDLSVFLWNTFGERRPKRWQTPRWREFLAGYQESRSISQEEFNALPLFLTARRIWLMGLDCRNQSGWPVQWLNSQWLVDMVRSIQSWEAEYPDLSG